LFITEIVWFVIRPVWLEIGEWKIRKKIILARRRIWLVIAIFFSLILLFFIPWRQTLVLDAVIHAKPYKVLFTTTGGRLVKFFHLEGDFVKQGDLVAKFENPNLSFKLQQIENKIKIQNALLQLSAFDKISWRYSAVTAAELARLQSEKEALDEKIMALNIHTPVSGEVSQVMKGMYDGQWLGEGQRLLSIKGQEGFTITAYINEEDVSRIEKNSSCHFKLMQQSFKRHECKLLRIGPTSEVKIEEKYLVSPYGGSISVSQVDGELIPNQALYKLSAHIRDREIKLNYKAKGLIEIDAERRNIIERFWNWSLALIIREGGM